MPLTQTRLNFQSFSSADSPPPAPNLSRASTASSDTLPCVPDADTIVVARPSLAARQLPTPSESSSDVTEKILGANKGSQTRVRLGADEPDKAEGPRVGALDKHVSPGSSRAVSGETLVVNASQSSLLRDGITALNLQWNMSSDFANHRSVMKGLKNEDQACGVENRIVHGSSNVEAQEKAERATKIKAKQEQNEVERLARLKASDAKATRRSSRVSILEKASDAVSDLASTVLGKRPRDILEKSKDALGDLKRRTSLRPRGTPTEAATVSFEGPTTKIRRLSEEATAKTDKDKSTENVNAVKSIRRSTKQKRFLNSGLYVGQSRPAAKKKGNASQQERELVPQDAFMRLPMFAGERLLDQGRDFKLPFNIFSPLPPGQPKPDEWKKVNKNVFVGDAGSIWRTSKFLEHSTCMCKPETGCDDDCQNRFMFYECDERNCNLSVDKCGNRSFDELRQRVKKGTKYSIGVEVIKTANRGYGVRSNRMFEPNQIIVEYTGEIITQDECESRMRERYKDNECYYLMLFDQNMIIDATRGSMARFVNHSCEPNCRMEKWTVAGKPRMALFAGEEGIMTGEELTYDYNFDPFSQKNVQECRCGSEKCRGVLGPKTKEERKPKSENNGGMMTGAKRKIAQVLDESTNLINKKRKTGANEELPKRKVEKSRPSSIPEMKKKAGVSRTSSMLKKVIEVSNKRATVRGGGKRTVSGTTSEKATMLSPMTEHSKGSVRVRAAASVRKNVVRTVKGRQSGRMRTIKALDPVVVEHGDDSMDG